MLTKEEDARWFQKQSENIGGILTNFIAIDHVI